MFRYKNREFLQTLYSFYEKTGYKKFEPKAETIEKSNVTFDVIKHTAFINNGSSGGGLLNYNQELIGINFASSVNSTTEEFVTGYAIPIEKVREFLDIYLTSY